MTAGSLSASTLLTIVLRSVGIALFHIGLARMCIWLRRRQPKVLVYHACEAEESDFLRGLSSNTTPKVFARHLAFLRRHYNVVPLKSLEDGTYPERAVVITFDDGYRSVVDQAVPLLRANTFPATMYLVTDVVDNARLVWVNELVWFLNARPEVSRERVARTLGVPGVSDTGLLIQHARMRYDHAVIEGLLQALRTTAGIDGGKLAREARLYVDWDQARAARTDGISFGNHTSTHPTLTRLDPGAQTLEMRRGQEHLTRELGGSTSLAYPFGSSSESLRAVARKEGFRSIMEVGGVNDPLDLSSVARVPVAATSGAALFAEIEVVAPGRAFLKRRLGRRQRVNAA